LKVKSTCQNQERGKLMQVETKQYYLLFIWNKHLQSINMNTIQGLNILRSSPNSKLPFIWASSKSNSFFSTKLLIQIDNRLNDRCPSYVFHILMPLLSILIHKQIYIIFITMYLFKHGIQELGYVILFWNVF
jgi:hypothetical protein